MNRICLLLLLTLMCTGCASLQSMRTNLPPVAVTGTVLPPSINVEVPRQYIARVTTPRIDYKDGDGGWPTLQSNYFEIPGYKTHQEFRLVCNDQVNKPRYRYDNQPTRPMRAQQNFYTLSVKKYPSGDRPLWIIWEVQPYGRLPHSDSVFVRVHSGF